MQVSDESVNVGLKADSSAFVRAFQNASKSVSDVAASLTGAESKLAAAETKFLSSAARIKEAFANLRSSSGSVAAADQGNLTELQTKLDASAKQADIATVAVDNMSEAIDKLGETTTQGEIGDVSKDLDEVSTTSNKSAREVQGAGRTFIEAFNDMAQAIQNVAQGLKWLQTQYESFENWLMSKARNIAKAAAGVVATTSAMATGSLVSFASFQSQMNNISTVADESVMSMSKMSMEIREMSRSKIPKTVEELARGMYEVASAGFQGAEGLQVLDASARFAVAGLTDTQVAVKGVTSLLNAYGLSAEHAANVTDVLFKAVEVGQMTAGEFVTQIGDWSAVASQLGVSIEEASGGIAALTRGGMPATLAATSFSSALRQLIRPTEEMGDAYKRLGWESGKAAIDQYGLVKVLNDLWEASGKNETTFSKMFNDVEGYRGALTLVTTQAEIFGDTVSEMYNKGLTGGSVNDAMAKQMQGLSMQFQLLKNNMREMTLVMGDMLSGPALKLLNFLNTLLGMYNGMPNILKKGIAGFQLLSATMLALTATLGAFMIKKALFMKLLPLMIKGLAGTRTGTLLTPFLAELLASGGPLKYAKDKLLEFSRATSVAKASMIKNLGRGLFVMGWATAAYQYITMLTDAFAIANQKADELAKTMDAVAHNSIDSLAALETELNNIHLRLEQLPDTNTRWNPIRSFKFAAEIATPGTDNTILEAMRQRQALEGLEDKYQDLAAAARMMSGITWMSTNDTLAALSGLAAEGKIDLAAFTKDYLEYLDLANMKNPTNLEEERLKELEKQWSALAPQLGKYANTQKEVAAAEKISSKNGMELAKALITIGDEASTATEKADAFRVVLDKLFGTPVDIRNFQANFLDAFEQLARVMIDNGSNFNLATLKGRELQSALSSASQSARDLAAATYEQTGDVAASADVMGEYVAGLIAMAQHAGWTDDAIAKMLGIMGLTPKTIQTLLDVKGLNAAQTQLLITQAYLRDIDGFVAKAGIDIEVKQIPKNIWNGIGVLGQPVPIGIAAPPKPGKGGANNLPNDWVSEWIKQATANIPDAEEVDEGKWKMSPALRNAVNNTLAKGAAWVLSGPAYTGFLMEEADRVRRWYATAYLNEATNWTSANIFRQAEADGIDPSDKIQDLATAYMQAADLVGEANAKMALNIYTSLESYQDWVAATVELIERNQKIQDYKYDSGQMNTSQYLAELRSRLVGLKEYSDEWIDLMLQIQSLEKKVVDEQAENVQKERTIMQRKYALDEISLADYRAYLTNMLNSFERYSDEWWDIQSELMDLQEDTGDQLKDWADQVNDALKDAFDNVVDPIKEATSLVGAFGDQMGTTQKDIQAFYSHMKQGTAEWINTINALRNQGLNDEMLKELIQQGPQGLSFAKSISDMGAGGIKFINDSMADINKMAADLGSSIALGSVGTVIQSQQNFDMTIGDITLSLDATGTSITMDDVKRAVDEGFSKFAASIK